MSPYIVAFHVSQFNHSKSKISETFGVYHVQSKKDQVVFAMTIGPKILHHYENILAFDYPLPKMDFVAVPDFRYGAMENWGLVNFRDVAILFKDGCSSIMDKERVAQYIAHELAHQWFGNLITCLNWGMGWLNEGFATYFEYLGGDFVQPNVGFRMRHYRADLQKVLNNDALATSDPVEGPDGKPLLQGAAVKAGALIRMAEHVLTRDVLLEGLQSYIKANAYGIVDTRTLWTELNAVAHKYNRLPAHLTMFDVMDPWFTQPGYPVLDVQADPNNPFRLTLTQSRFLLQEKGGAFAKWILPISISTGFGQALSNTTPTLFMVDKETEVVLDAIPFIINVQQTGLFRVNYDEAHWAYLGIVLQNNHAIIEPLTRTQLLDDSLTLARAGQLSYSVALEMTRYLVMEQEYIPWDITLKNFEYVDLMLRTTKKYEKFKLYVKELLANLDATIGYTPDTDDKYGDILMRNLVVRWMCFYSHLPCLLEVQALMAEWMTDPDASNPVPVDLRAEMYRVAVRNGPKRVWDFLWSRSLVAPIDTERRSLLEALGHSKDSNILRDYLNKTIDSHGGIRKQDVTFIYDSIGANEPGRSVQMDWLDDHFEEIKLYFGDLFSKVMKTILDKFAMGVNTKEQFKRMNLFRTKHDSTLGHLNFNEKFNRILSQAELNLVWMESKFNSVVQWLELRDQNAFNVTVPTVYNEIRENMLQVMTRK